MGGSLLQRVGGGAKVITAIPYQYLLYLPCMIPGYQKLVAVTGTNAVAIQTLLQPRQRIASHRIAPWTGLDWTGPRSSAFLWTMESRSESKSLDALQRLPV